MEILHFEDLGDTECHLAANTVVLVLGGYQISIAMYLRGVSTLKFERDPLNIFRVRVLISPWSTGGRGRSDAKTIISPNTSFGDIICNELHQFRDKMSYSCKKVTLFDQLKQVFYYYYNYFTIIIPVIFRILLLEKRELATLISFVSLHYIIKYLTNLHITKHIVLSHTLCIFDVFSWMNLPKLAVYLQLLWVYCDSSIYL